MNLRLVEALIVVSEEGSMSRAANRLGLSQQAVSSQVAALERLVGDQLVARTSRGVALTPSGAVVVERGRALLRAADQMTTEVRAVADGRAGRLRVACKAQGTAHFLPQVVTALERQTVDIRIDMTTVATIGQEIEALLDGTADAAFVWLPIADDRIESATVLSEPRVVALPPDHRLSARERVTLADLTDEPTIGPHSAPREISRDWVIDPRPDGSTPVYGPEVHSYEEGLLQVAAGRGVLVVPASVAGYFTRPHLAWVPVVDAPGVDLALAWSQGRHTRLLDALITCCRRLGTRDSPAVPPLPLASR